MSNPVVRIVIPARFGSSRFPGKPLAEILGKTMIQWVWEAVVKNRHGARVIVATDDRRIQEVALGFGAEVWLTSSSHPSGTDRMAEVAKGVDGDLWINTQGDEPMIDCAEVDRLIDFTLEGGWEIATMAHVIDREDEWRDPDVVKVIFREDGTGLYFSRSPVPFSREWPLPSGCAWRHVGVYAYRREALERFVQSEPGEWERCEGLEQLRALAMGIRIGVMPTTLQLCGVDRREDLAKVEKRLRLRTANEQY
jgi:3-deoxy-manno-octulosonate cytidylyltransferase (CMP-KDO synthetase)